MKINALLGIGLILGGLLGCATARAELDAKNKRMTTLRAVTGHPCLKFHEIVRPQIAMKDMYDHVVTVENQCPDAILVKICYRNANTGCRKVRANPHKKASTLLGSMYNQPSFGFEYTEAYAQ